MKAWLPLGAAGAGSATLSLPALTAFRACLLVAALAILVYLNTLPNAFVIDDRAQILQNGFLRRPDGLKKIFTTNVGAFLGSQNRNNYYRPLMHTAWYFGWRMFRENPAGYRALNILLHAAVSVLVFLCLRRVQPNTTAAWLAALLFAVHPIHVEAVGWISALPDLLCTFFSLLGFWLYLRAEDTSQGMEQRRYWLEVGVGACVLLALLAKEIGFVMPLLLVLYEFSRGRAWISPEQRGTQSPRRLFLCAAIAASFAVYLGMRWYALGGLMPASWGFKGGWPEMIAGWIALLYEYTVRIVLPTRLSSFHVMPTPGSLFDGKVLAGLAIAGGLGVLAVWLYRRGRPEWLAVALFLVGMAPSFPATTLRVDGFWMGERYLYMPSIGFCWLLAVALCGERHSCLSRAGWKLVAGLTLALLAAYSARTVLRNQDWRDEIQFYLQELRTEGESPVLRPLLTEAYVRRGSPRDALEHAQAMVRLAPRDSFAHNSLGFVYWLLGEREKALAEYRLAAEYARESGRADSAARALNNIAVAYSNLGRLDLAIPEYQEALRLDPAFADGHNNLGLALYHVGRLEEALVHLRTAIRLDPAFTAAHANLGLVLAARRDLPAARTALAEAIRLEPGNAEALARMGDVQLFAGDPEAARRYFARALSLDPVNERALAGMSALRSR